MTEHRDALILAATAFDFPLDPRSRHVLDEHLAACPACRSETGLLAADARRLTELPAIAPPPHVRDRLGTHRSRSRIGLLAAAALVTVVSIASLGLAGAIVDALRPDPALVPVPSSEPSASPSSTLGPTAEPTASAIPVATSAPTPSGPPVQPPTFVLGSLPLPSGTVSITPDADGGAWVLVHTLGTAVAADRATLVLLDPQGRPRPGWPLGIEGSTCAWQVEYGPWSPQVAADGSVRVLCAFRADDSHLAQFAYAFDRSGALLDGWPVDLGPDEISEAPRAVADDLVVVARNIVRDEGENPQSVTYRLIRVTTDGRVERGTPVSAVAVSLQYGERLGADGVAYVRDTDEPLLDDEGRPLGPVTTRLTGLDSQGIRDGWPLTIEGLLSDPVVGPDGALYFSRIERVTATEGVAWVASLVVVDRDGGVREPGPVSVAGAGLHEATFAGGDSPLPPVVSRDGSAWLATTGTQGRVVLHLVTAAGQMAPGWPWEAEQPLELRGRCSGLDTGCGVWRTLLAAGPGGALYAALQAPPRGQGGQLVAIGPDGRLVDGWPVGLRAGNARWDMLAVASDGTIIATAVEPSGGGDGVTVLGIAPDSSVLWRTTVVAP
jgi:hypothetical protein